MEIARFCGRRPLIPAQHTAVPIAESYFVGLAPSGKDIDWSRNMPDDDWGECANDQVGNCTIAGMIHGVYTWGSYVPPNPTYTDQQAIQYYSESAGYVPGVAVTDRGNTCIAALNWWKTNTLGGEPILGFYRFDPTNVALMRLVIEIAGFAYLGVALTQDQIDNSPDPWDFTGTPGTLGHCVPANAHDNASGGVKGVTWGMPGQVLTPAFIQNCVDEAYVVVSARWLKGGKTPEGFPVEAFMNDVQGIAI